MEEMNPTTATEVSMLQAELNRYRHQSLQREAVEPVHPPTYGGDLAQDTPIPPQDVVIGKVSNGFIVKVGCQTYVSQNWEEVSEGLELFFTKPQEAIKKFYKKV